MGNGAKIRFWSDKWAGDNSFQSIYPLLADVALNHKTLVCEQGRFIEGCWGWKLLTQRVNDETAVEK